MLLDCYPAQAQAQEEQQQTEPDISHCGLSTYAFATRFRIPMECFLVFVAIWIKSPVMSGMVESGHCH
jgi:hypothetical protein